MNQYSLGEAAQVLGRSYSQCWHAYAYGKLRWPRRVGRTFVLDGDDLAALQAYFKIERKDGDREPVSTVDRRVSRL
jgi:hypothetical protein